VLSAATVVLLLSGSAVACNSTPAVRAVHSTQTTTSAPASGPGESGARASTSTTLSASGLASESSLSGPASTGPETPAYSAPPPPTGWTVAGTSVQGRPILIKRFGHGPQKVVWLGGIHGNEIEGSVATANLPAAFSAAHLDSKVTLVVIWDANPDGRALHIRTNANGFDLNRQFPSANFGYGADAPPGEPLSQPEAKVVHDIIVKEKPNLVVACHSWWGDQFINYDGPAAEIAARFSALSGFPVKTSDQLGPDLSGSMGNWIGVDMGIPILTIEWLHGSDPVVGWQRTQAAIISAITPPFVR
jgi:hypothetical protein